MGLRRDSSRTADEGRERCGSLPPLIERGVALNRIDRPGAAIETLERRRLMADFRLTSHLLLDEDYLPNPSPSIRLSATTGDSVLQQVRFATSSVPSEPNVEYHFTTLGITLIARDSDFFNVIAGTGNWFITKNHGRVVTAGSYQATVRLDATNLVAETNETNNDSTITYNAVAAPEIRLYGANSDKIVDGQVPTSLAEGTDFGFVVAGGPPVDRVFTITNVGVLPLTTANLSVPAGFSIVEGLSPTIASGGSETFTLRAQTLSPVHGEVAFTTNDLNERDFNFPIQANIPRPVATSTALDVSVSPARVLVSFNVNVGGSVGSGDFRITNIATGQIVASATPTYDVATNTAVIRFVTPPANGRYRLTSVGDIADLYGNPLASPVSYDFSYIRGDIDSDGIVGFSDLLILAQNYGQTGRTFAQGNIDYSPDGSVNFGDLLVLASQYGSTPPLEQPTRVTRIALDVLR